MDLDRVHSLPGLVSRSARLFATAPALVKARTVGGAGLTYQELRDRMVAGATTFRAAGLRSGERVVLLLEAGPEWAAAFFAILDAGLVAVPFPPNWPPEALAATTAHAAPAAVVVDQQNEERAQAIAPGRPTFPVAELFRQDGGTTPPPPTSPDDLALLAFTSGTTHRPRGVELTHGNLLGDLAAILRVRTASPEDAFLSMLPPAHLFELVLGLLGPLACGARVVYAGSLLPNRLVEAVRDERITHALAVPALVGALYEEIVEELLEAGVVRSESRDESPSTIAERLESEPATDLVSLASEVRSRIGETFRHLMVGGAAVDPAFPRIVAAMGIRMEVGYGLTEAGPIVSAGLAEDCPRASVGRPLPGIAVRVDEHGEILVRGSNVMRGYFKDPEATAAALENGWLRTGDHGRLEDGFLFVTGRLKDALVTAAGETIYPEEAEYYYKSPLFQELCVAALAGEHGNDIPALFVVQIRDVTPERLEEAFADLRAAAPARLRVERLVSLAAPLPRTASGKIRRRILAEEWRERSQ